MLQTTSLRSSAELYQMTGHTETSRNKTEPLNFQMAVARLASVFSKIDHFLFFKCISQPQTINSATERRSETRHVASCFSFLKMGLSEKSESPAALEQGLVSFASERGINRLKRSKANHDFYQLANQFEPQSNNVFCGATSAAIVLNALRAPDPSLPRDRRRLSLESSQGIPEGKDFTVPRFTQEIIVDAASKVKNPAQVFGKPVIINGQEISDFGYQLDQLNQVLKDQRLKTTMTIVDEQLDNKTVKKQLISILQQKDHYVIAAYKRDAVGQHGGGHFSPLGAYDSKSDSFLVMDVNPSKEKWVWMPADTLIRGMRTLDVVANRGFISVCL